MLRCSGAVLKEIELEFPLGEKLWTIEWSEVVGERMRGLMVPLRAPVPRLFRRNPRSGFGAGGTLDEGVGGSDMGWCFGSDGGMAGVVGCSCR